MQHYIEQLARDFTPSNENANPDNWEWKVEAPWVPAGERWKQFHSKWYGATESESASLADPNSPFLSLEPLPSAVDPTIKSKIFVRDSYVTMFDTVWAEAMRSRGKHGVIITGQPGIGKTLLDFYLLVRLLQRKQVILFSPNGINVYLFYHNEVYTGNMGALDAKGFDISLPGPRSDSKVFIWSLFDIHDLKEPASFMVTYPCLPVQTTSPDPIRYETWEEKWMPLLTGLPLWTRDELAQGLQYQVEYRSLWNALNQAYGSSSPNLDPLYAFPGAHALLEERYSEEDTVPPSPQDALDYLLDAAIDRFGYSARDVFGAVFNYSWMTQHHENAFGLTPPELQVAVSALSKSRPASYSISHWILAIRPVDRGPFMSVRWDVDFKSDWVARNVIGALGDAQDDAIRQQIMFFRGIPGARELAGRMLEPLVHRYIASATVGLWQLINMKSNAADPPHFTLDRASPVAGNVHFFRVKHDIVKLQSIADLSTCLENNTYYVPTDPDFPLFDAFAIELDHERKSAILWVLQVTTSRMHGGSAMGYRKIRDIIAILKDELRGDPPLKKSKMAGRQATRAPLVQVRYLLVDPKDGSQSQDLHWQFPKGWSQNRERHDHVGNVYCLEVPRVM